MLTQGAALISTGNFSLRKFRASKACNVSVGDRFWVTTSSLSNERGVASIAREGRGHISSGYSMKVTDILANFQPVA